MIARVLAGALGKGAGNKLATSAALHAAGGLRKFGSKGSTWHGSSGGGPEAGGGNVTDGNPALANGSHMPEAGDSGFRATGKAFESHTGNPHPAPTDVRGGKGVSSMNIGQEGKLAWQSGELESVGKVTFGSYYNLNAGSNPAAQQAGG